MDEDLRGGRPGWNVFLEDPIAIERSSGVGGRGSIAAQHGRDAKFKSNPTFVPSVRLSANEDQHVDRQTTSFKLIFSEGEPLFPGRSGKKRVLQSMKILFSCEDFTEKSFFCH
jgi:hypothetical protein